MYESDKRLQRRAYWDSTRGEIRLPFDERRGGPVKVAPDFIEHVAQHIELAFQQNVIDAVFFPDMGHSHFFIPETKFDEVYRPLPVEKMARFYELFFSDSDLKVLYHTAEQLQTRDENGEVLSDPRLRFRYQTRNLLGRNDGTAEIQFLQNPQSPANTAHDLPGHRYWGAGFNLSAQKNGCFSFQRNGKTYYFDLSLYDLPSDPSNGEFQFGRRL